MEIFGGLYVIKKRVALDILTLAFLLYNAIATITLVNTTFLVLIYTWTLQSTNLTGRWTLTFPMTLYLPLHILKAYVSTTSSSWTMLWSILLGLVTIISSILCLLFPPVQIPPVKGDYSVGVVDFFLPLQPTNDHNQDHVSVRLLYPTDQTTSKPIPYLNPPLAKQICNLFMKLASPPPLRAYGFILHYWTLIQLSLQRNAPLSSLSSSSSSSSSKFPMVVFSHGLFGTAEIYSYQTMSMAANGSVVLVIHHSDGSAPIMTLADGSTKDFNEALQKRFNGPEVDSIRDWRASVEERSIEFIAAAKAFLTLNTTNIPALEKLNISFVNRLNTTDMTFSGHSFGGGTCVTAAFRHPELVTRVVGFDPCCEWLPDDVRRALFFDYSRGNGDGGDGGDVYDGGIGGFQTSMDSKKVGQTVFGSKDVFFLFSNEWDRNNSASCKTLIKMTKDGTFGRPNCISRCVVVKDAQHQEFSDTCLLIPTWIARPAGSTGPRSPVDTLEESAGRVRNFLELSRSSME